MAVKIDFHYDLSILARQLAENIQAEVKGENRSLFEPVRVIIPINHFQAWLPLQIAAGSANKVAANLRFQYMETALWDMLLEIAPAGLKEAVPLDKQTAALRVLKVLLDLKKDNPGALAPFRDYLYGAQGSGEKPEYRAFPDFEKRVWNLSIKLAGLLLDYEYHRQEMVASWRGGKPHTKVSMEKCQMALYLAVFPDDNPATGLTLPRLADAVFKKVEKPAEKKTAHFFGFSELSRRHIEILWRLGVHFNIHIYQFNVCREFWEDVTTRQEDAFLRSIKNSLVKEEVAEEEKLKLMKGQSEIADNPLLKAWGKPGRELIKGYSAADELIPEAEAESSHPEFDNWQSERKNLLYRLQGQVLDRLTLEKDKKERNTITQDNSIQIAACSDIYREVETVYNSILWNLDHTGGLKSTDITVLVSDMAKYKPVIQSVFSRKGNTAPFNLTDSTAEKESVYGQAVTAILGLAGGAFSRSDLFGVFYNPCFMQAAGACRADVDQWSEWARNLNIYRWAGPEHKMEDTAGGFTADLYTWEWGLKRLRLGRIMGSNEGSTSLPPVYADLQSRDAYSVSRFSGTAERLIRRLRQLSRSEKQKPSQWAAGLKDLFETFLAIPGDRKEEAAVRNTLFGALDSFAKNAEQTGLHLKFNLVGELVKGSLSQVASRIGTYGAGGVTVASIKNARPIPFQLVYILGLEENSFPADTVRSTLDLRTHKRKIGDISPRDHDLFRFLEALMSARKKLYLTYIGRDLQKDETFQPSSAVKQLLYAMDPILEGSQSFPGEMDYGVKYKGFKMPLHGFSERYLEVVPDCFDLCVNYSKSDRKVFQTFQTPSNNKSADKTAINENKQPASPKTPGRSTGSEVDEVKSSTVEIWRLNRFLRNPVESQLRYHLGMSGEQVDDTREVDEERFQLEYPSNYNFMSQVLDRCLELHLSNSPVNVAGECEQLYEAWRNRGEAADFVFGDMELEQLKNTVENRWLQFSSLSSEFDKSLSYHRRILMGQSYETEGTEVEPCKFEVENGTAEISGSLDHVWADSELRNFEAVRWCFSSSPGELDLLDTFLLHSAVQCSRKLAPGIARVHVITNSGKAACEYQWESLESCRGYLNTLLNHFLNRKSFDWLPWSIIKEACKKEMPSDPEAFRLDIEQRISEAVSGSYSDFRKMLQLHLLEPEVPGDALDVVKARLLPLLNFKKCSAKKKK